MAPESTAPPAARGDSAVSLTYVRETSRAWEEGNASSGTNSSARYFRADFAVGVAVGLTA
jgi:hypothetical protein